ncbi:MAG TPA: hypothetical protein VM580_08420, partial [Labilithrix sp.]|nr:hypothetical protein [Labilithrix sp.]
MRRMLVALVVGGFTTLSLVFVACGGGVERTPAPVADATTPPPLGTGDAAGPPDAEAPPGDVCGIADG